MVQLKLGKINHEERKFIPAKKNFFDEYINSLKEIEEHELMQIFKDEYKYRCYNDNGELIKKTRKYYIDGEFEIDVDYYKKPIEMVLVKVASFGKKALEEYEAPYGFIEVTGNSKFEDSNIYKGSIISSGTIIEGTDGVGKTTTIEGLLKKGIICQDRCMEIISVNMLFEVPMEERARKYNEYLKKINKKVIFLINNDKEELERRINSRKKLSAYDEEAYRYNLLYLDTFKYMKENNMLEGKLFMVDCTGLSINEVIDETEKIIMEEGKNINNYQKNRSNN